MLKIKYIVTFIALISSTNAWWGKGHLLVARIAYDLLNEGSEGSPDTIVNVDEQLSYLEHSDPVYTKKEGDYPFVECTTFADDIKNSGGSY